MPYKDPTSPEARASARRNAANHAARYPEKVKERRARWGAANRDHERRKAKERRDKLKAYGLCVWCSVNKTAGTIYCDVCKAKGKKAYSRMFTIDPLWVSKRNRKLRYSITKEEFDAMREAQEYKCAICRKHESKCKKGLHLDHNHETGKIRGLLCAVCNLSLPIVEHERILPRPATESWKHKAREYLKQHEANNNQRGIRGC